MHIKVNKYINGALKVNPVMHHENVWNHISIAKSKFQYIGKLAGGYYHCNDTDNLFRTFTFKIIEVFSIVHVAIPIYQPITGPHTRQFPVVLPALPQQAFLSTNPALP